MAGIQFTSPIVTGIFKYCHHQRPWSLIITGTNPFEVGRNLRLRYKSNCCWHPQRVFPSCGLWCFLKSCRLDSFIDRNFQNFWLDDFLVRGLHICQRYSSCHQVMHEPVDILSLNFPMCLGHVWTCCQIFFWYSPTLSGHVWTCWCNPKCRFKVSSVNFHFEYSPACV